VNRARSWRGEVRGGDQKYFNCSIFGYIARNCRNRRDIKEGTQEKSKENGDQ